MGELFAGLHQLRRRVCDEQWEAFCVACREHPICALLHEDPLTAYAFSKPNGFAPDATITDFVHSEHAVAELLSRATPLGLEIHRWILAHPMGHAVRQRTVALARMIDDATECIELPRVLAAACGHSPVIARWLQTRRKSVGQFVALDEDSSNVALLRSRYGHLGIEAMRGTPQELIARDGFASRFDLIYAANALNRMQDPEARQFIEALFAMLKPGGMLCVVNVLPDLEALAYMESFMAWKCITRTPLQMRELATGLKGPELEGCYTSVESSGAMVFLELYRAGSAIRRKPRLSL
jgi:hypothetical protein